MRAAALMTSPRALDALQATLRGLWFGVIPALLSALVLKFLVPLPGPGLRGIVSTLGRQYPVPLGATSFLLFSLLARHWWLRLPLDVAGTAQPRPTARKGSNVIRTPA